MSTRVATILACIITGVWAVSVGMDMFTSYESPEGLNAVMMAVAGGLVAASRARGKKDDES